MVNETGKEVTFVSCSSTSSICIQVSLGLKTTHDDVSQKISTSKLQYKNKEIFTLFLALFGTINAERDEKIVQLE